MAPSIGISSGDISTGSALSTGGVSPPAGFVFLVDYDGAYLTDADGAYLVEPV